MAERRGETGLVPEWMHRHGVLRCDGECSGEFQGQGTWPWALTLTFPLTSFLLSDSSHISWRRGSRNRGRTAACPCERGGMPSSVSGNADTDGEWVSKEEGKKGS